MKKYFLFIFTIATFSCQSPHNSQEESQASDSLSPQLEAIYQRGNLPGFSVSLVEADQIVYQEAFGQADVREAKKYTLSTRQPLGSISKTLIGLSLLKAQELGKLQLDDPINKYLPYPIQNPHFPEVDITIRHLAHHTSTITDTDQYENSSYFLRNNDHLEAQTPIKLYEYFNPPEAPLPIRAFMKNMLYTDADSCCREVFLQEKPGSTYQYSNGASTLAAVILEIATDMSFRDFTKKYILQPLDMKTSSWDPEDIDATLYYDGDTVFAEYYLRDYPAGGLITNTEELSKYLQELIKGYNGNGALLSPESYATLFNSPFAQELANEAFPEEENPFLNVQYQPGVFMGIAPRGFIGHTGADPGTVTFMFFNIKSNRGFVFISNRIIWTEFEEALKDLLEIIGWLEKASS